LLRERYHHLRNFQIELGRSRPHPTLDSNPSRPSPRIARALGGSTNLRGFRAAQFREAYIERWSEGSQPYGAWYDAVRCILPDAIRRAGTTEAETMTKALEATYVETSLARFVWTLGRQVNAAAHLQLERNIRNLFFTYRYNFHLK